MSVFEDGSTDVLNASASGPTAPSLRGLPRSLRIVLGVAAQIQCGRLEIVVPDGRRFLFRGTQDGPNAEIVIHRPRAARRFLLGGTVGFSEAYLDGDWESPDLTAFLELATANEQVFDEKRLRGRFFVAFVHRIWHLFNRNSRKGSRRNIAQHYDLGNAFYERWLDRTMTYSSAVFASPEDDLEAAQTRKYERLARLLSLQPDHHVLEIGCGWGGFAEHAARHYGCRVTAITLSREQCAYARQRIEAAGLSDRVSIELIDYRDVTGTYDRIASIEMFEAVGEAYWPTYFSTLRDRLKPGGLAALQIITIEDRWFDAYRRGADFIQRYVFPGGMLPSPTALRSVASAAGLEWLSDSGFGRHYAQTLNAWHQRFNDSWSEIQPLGFDDRFQRLWKYYLSYCEAGFRAGWLDVMQLALVRR